jgi:FkbM family methyltransferase
MLKGGVHKQQSRLMSSQQYVVNHRRTTTMFRHVASPFLAVRTLLVLAGMYALCTVGNTSMLPEFATEAKLRLPSLDAQQTLAPSCVDQRSMATQQDIKRIINTIFHEDCELNGASQPQNKTAEGNAVDEASIFTKVRRKSCLFEDIGRRIVKDTISANKTIFTVQIGGMDGKSNDPMYKMMRSLEPRYHGNWIPMVIEPVRVNYDKLVATYDELKASGQVTCPLVLHRAVSLEAREKCTFCSFNTTSTSDRCQQMPDWKKYQLGTLQCDWSRKLFGNNFDECIAVTEVDCGPIPTVIKSYGMLVEDVAMLQMDVEGYENDILNGLFSRISPDVYPPILYFEHKVIKGRNSTILEELYSKLSGAGYLLFDHWQDTMALLIDPPKE